MPHEKSEKVRKHNENTGLGWEGGSQFSARVRGGHDKWVWRAGIIPRDNNEVAAGRWLSPCPCQRTGTTIPPVIRQPNALQQFIFSVFPLSTRIIGYYYSLVQFAFYYWLIFTKRLSTFVEFVVHYYHLLFFLLINKLEHLTAGLDVYIRKGIFHRNNHKNLRLLFPYSRLSLSGYELPQYVTLHEFWRRLHRLRVLLFGNMHTL